MRQKTNSFMKCMALILVAILSLSILGSCGTKGEKGEPGAQGEKGIPGENGKSAFELAVENGYIGTVEEWLASLVGEAGATGLNGQDGKNGVSIIGAHIDANLHLILEMSDGTTIDAGYVGVPTTPDGPKTPTVASEGLEYEEGYVIGIGTCTDKDIILPEKDPQGNPIIGIAGGAFENTSITSITLPKTIEEIDAGAFKNCNALTDVHFKGTEDEWAGVTVASRNNTSFTSATMHFAETEVKYTNPTIEVSNTTASKLDKVDVAVFIYNSTEMSNSTLTINYDEDAMTLISATNGTSIPADSSNLYTGPANKRSGCRAIWVSQDTYTPSNGKLIILQFQIKDTAQNGNYNVNVTYDYKDAQKNVVSFDIVNGTITIK